MKSWPRPCAVPRSDQVTAADGAAALSGVDLFTLPVAPPPQVSGYDPENGHPGIDFAAEEGAEVYAVAGGIVTAADYDVEKGNYVVLDHGGGLETEYQHMKSLLVSAGQSVVQVPGLGICGRAPAIPPGRTCTLRHGRTARPQT